MLKKDELSNPDSCLNKAEDDEPIFVLRGKDMCAVDIVLAWVSSRISSGIDDPLSHKIRDALFFIHQVQEWQNQKEGK